MKVSRFLLNIKKKVCKGCGCKSTKIHNATECEIIRVSVNILVQKRTRVGIGTVVTILPVVELTYQNTEES